MFTGEFLGFTGTFFSNSEWDTALEQANLTKLHTFAAKHKVNTYSENFFQSDDSVSIWS